MYSIILYIYYDYFHYSNEASNGDISPLPGVKVKKLVIVDKRPPPPLCPRFPFLFTFFFTIVLNIILKKLVNGQFEEKYLEYVKKAYMVEHYETCLNNSYLSGFYGEQYINQLYNIGKKPVILSFDKVADSILNITKAKFIKFIKKLLIFPNMKLAYQGKEEQEGLEKLVLNKIK